MIFLNILNNIKLKYKNYNISDFLKKKYYYIQKLKIKY